MGGAVDTDITGRHPDQTTRSSAGAAQFQDEAADTRVPRGEAVVVDQVLPDRDRVPPAPQRLDDQLAILKPSASLQARGALRVERGVPIQPTAQ
jgi:hypothetical protein